MKTLLETSIKIKGIGHPDTKTIFDSLSDEDKKRERYKDISTMGNRKVIVVYNFTEDGVEKEDKITLIIPKLSEIEIKNFIISEINNELTK